MSSTVIKTRIAPVETPFSPALTERMARLLPPGMAAPVIFRTTAVNEGLFNDMVDMGLIGRGGLLHRGVMKDRLRELIILRTCVAAGNDYEWELHVQTISARMGLSEAQIDDTRAAQPSAEHWSAAELAVMDFVDALVRTHALPDEEFAVMRAHFSAAEMVEMTMLTGQYLGVALLVAVARPQFDTYRPLRPRLGA